MVIIYTAPSCASCRKAKAWFDDHKIDYVEKNFFQKPLTHQEIKAILRMTENGTSDIITTRSSSYRKLNVDLDSLPLKELLDLLVAHPGLLKKPIIMDEKHSLVGYSDDEIRRFLPRSIRRANLRRAESRANALPAS